MATTKVPPMKILFLCTAHNSLSQRLYLELTAAGHDVSIEYALSDKIMIEAVELFDPNLIICPFLTARVPAEVYNNVVTLIVHPGVPGDAGPSAIDWVLMGDDGELDEASKVLEHLGSASQPGRNHWGVTVLQAVEELDAGPVWAFEQFPLDVDTPGLTKSGLYRGPIARAALTATRAAIARIVQAIDDACNTPAPFLSLPTFNADPKYAQLSVTSGMPFQGGKTHTRPLLKATQRDFDLTKHTSVQISRRIKSADSQPGVLTRVFGQRYYVYGGHIEHMLGSSGHPVTVANVELLFVEDESVCIQGSDGHGVWISHLRRPKTGGAAALNPKMPAISCLLEDGVLTSSMVDTLREEWTLLRSVSTEVYIHQEIKVDIRTDENGNTVAYLHFDFYNGATRTDQCKRLIEAMDRIIARSTPDHPIHAVALMGSKSYFSNGIALNVIEAAADPALESWNNINAIDDIVYHLLHDFPAHGILTFACIRGNAAAGGVALAAACDFVIAGSEVVLNPAYRAVGLHGSEYHSITYPARCGEAKAKELLRGMLPLSPVEAQRIGLVDYVFPGYGEQLDEHLGAHISFLLQPKCLTQGLWKAGRGGGPGPVTAATLAAARTSELAEMAKDFWSARSTRYDARRFAFVRKMKPTKTPRRFAKHRRGAGELDEEERDDFNDVELFQKRAQAKIIEAAKKEFEVVSSGCTTRSTSSTDVSVGDAEAKVAELSIRGDGGEKQEQQSMFSCYYQPEVSKKAE